jgi:hypothetical protein
MSFNPNVVFAGYTCKMELGRYPNGNLAISLVDIVSGQPVATATKNITGVVLGPGESCIKDYSENEGMVNALRKAGVVDSVAYAVKINHVEIPVVRFSAEAVESFDRGFENGE